MDHSGDISADLPCQRCQYNLRGLSPDGRCPECFTPVSRSVHRDLLRYAEPEYVKKLARGSRWILRGVTVGLICLIGSFVLGLVASLSGVGGFAEDLLIVLVLIAAIVFVLAFIAVVWGIWCLTVPQPNVFATGKRDATRRLVRIYLLVAFLGVVVGRSVEAVAPPPSIMAAFELLYIGVSILGVVGTVAYFVYLRSVVRRVSTESLGGHDRLPQHARTLAKGFGIVLGWVVLIRAVETIMTWGPVLLPSGAGRVPTSPGQVVGATALPTVWNTFMDCSLGIAFLSAVILALAAARLHHRLKNALNEEAVRASENWNAVSTEHG